MSTNRYSRVTGWGMGIPEKVVTNDELSRTLDTSDAWITERTGIKERRIGGSTKNLAVQAGAKAMEVAGVSPEDIDLLVLATTTPDRTIPATSVSVQEALGLNCGAMDINAACSGFVYGLSVAHGQILGGASRVLLIGSETLSRFLDWEDRSTAVLFGDGAGAVVLEASDNPGGLLSCTMHADGSLEHLIYCDLPGTIHMKGREVFRKAVQAMEDACRIALEKAGCSAEDISLLIPHQANIRIISAAADRLGIGSEKVVEVLSWTGNTSSASIPTALVDAVEKGRVADGDLLLLAGFGAGMTSAGAVLEWGAARQAAKSERKPL